MKYNELSRFDSKKNQRRKGRGIAAGRGKTAGRGTKGQGSRKSGRVRPGFEGGQMPLYMRLPKLRGFKSHRSPSSVVYTAQLDALKKTLIDNQTLFDGGLVDSPYQSVKLLSRGPINAKKEIRLQSASQSARDAVILAGGSFTATARVGQPVKKTAPLDK